MCTYNSRLLTVVMVVIANQRRPRLSISWILRGDLNFSSGSLSTTSTTLSTCDSSCEFNFCKPHKTTICLVLNRQGYSIHLTDIVLKFDLGCTLEVDRLDI